MELCCCNTIICLGFAYLKALFTFLPIFSILHVKGLIRVDYEKLGKQIRDLRKFHDMTQSQLAAEAGLSTSFLGHIERGSRKASLETFVALANALGAQTDMLLRDSLALSGDSAKAEQMRRQRLIRELLLELESIERP